MPPVTVIATAASLPRQLALVTVTLAEITVGSVIVTDCVPVHTAPEPGDVTKILSIATEGSEPTPSSSFIQLNPT